MAMTMTCPRVRGMAVSLNLLSAPYSIRSVSYRLSLMAHSSAAGGTSPAYPPQGLRPELAEFLPEFFQGKCVISLDLVELRWPYPAEINRPEGLRPFPEAGCP